MATDLHNFSFDYIIVGQGLAGTLLAYFLEQANKTVLVIDDANPTSSSQIAAGIIHPVTGRRIVKSWKTDELTPFAEKTYQTIGKKLNRPFYYQKNILEIFTSTKHRNDWLARSSESEMEKYTGDEVPANHLPGIRIPLGGMFIQQSGYLKINEFINCFHQYFQDKKCLMQERFDYAALQITTEGIQWKNIAANDLIFCEGASSSQNPYFSWLPFIPAKGEILTIHAPDLTEEYILNRSLYCLPIGNHYFKVGATHEWKDLNDIPTAAAKEKMIRLISEMISTPFKITAHHAAIRPTVKDRRPFLGTHPEFRHLHIFNGLGTKGVMLAPYFANQLCQFLINKKEIDKEVNIARFL